MQNNQWCKIIPCGEHQVLITKDYDEDEEVHRIVCTCDIDGVRASISMGFESEESRDKVFEDHAEEAATSFINDMNKIIKEP